MNNYSVTTKLEVRAESAEAAIDQVTDALRKGYKGLGISPVADYSVTFGAPNLLDKVYKNEA